MSGAGGSGKAMAIIEIVNSILAFDEKATVRCVQNELARGTDAALLLNDGLIAAMDEVGRRYDLGIFFVPEMLMATQAMKEGLSALRPHFADTDLVSSSIIVIGTVQGDYHDIGKNLVAMMLECAGFRVIDLGRDVEAGKFVEAAQHNGAEIVALSALLTTTLGSMREAISQIKAMGNSPKVLVGGAPVTREFAGSIGADGFSPDAVGAVTVARRLNAFRADSRERKPPLH
jgi:5-methyltetrahydrofolate--homocysteine methyltransferase